MSGRTVGIDLGTTNSAVATVTMDDPEIIKNSEGGRVTPSVVAFNENTGEAIVGKQAVNQAAMKPERTVKKVKREMGDENWTFEVDGDSYTPEEISSLILTKLVDGAQDFLDQSVESAVITVPAYFGENERTRTKTAGEIAGLEVDHILPEPSAACLAYGLHKSKTGGNDGEKELAFVYDLGGGTFDATLVDIAGDYSMIETLHTEGDQGLGGEDWDEAIVDWIAERIEAETGFDVRDDPEQLSRVKDSAKEAKHTLSQSESTSVTIPYVVPDQGYNFDEELTRDKFDELTADLLDQTIDCCDELFGRADYDPADVDKVLLVGGSTRMVQVQEAVEEYFGQEPSKEIDPDEAVAKGAAVQAQILDQGGEDAANLLPGDADHLVLVDAVPQTLGVELHDGSMDPLIEQDESIPASQDDVYTTAADNQTQVNVKVYQGEHFALADHEENTYLGNLRLTGIEPRPKHVPDINVEFTLDENGTLQVTARDDDSGKEVNTTFESVFHVSDEEIDEMKKGLPAVE